MKQRMIINSDDVVYYHQDTKDIVSDWKDENDQLYYWFADLRDAIYCKRTDYYRKLMVRPLKSTEKITVYPNGSQSTERIINFSLSVAGGWRLTDTYSGKNSDGTDWKQRCPNIDDRAGHMLDEIKVVL